MNNAAQLPALETEAGKSSPEIRLSSVLQTVNAHVCHQSGSKNEHHIENHLPAKGNAQSHIDYGQQAHQTSNPHGPYYYSPGFSRHCQVSASDDACSNRTFVAQKSSLIVELFRVYVTRIDRFQPDPILRAGI
jgi:hypothetical protein